MAVANTPGIEVPPAKGTNAYAREAFTRVSKSSAFRRALIFADGDAEWRDGT